jgi:hypothetical protein
MSDKVIQRASIFISVEAIGSLSEGECTQRTRRTEDLVRERSMIASALRLRSNIAQRILQLPDEHSKHLVTERLIVHRLSLKLCQIDNWPLVHGLISCAKMGTACCQISLRMPMCKLCTRRKSFCSNSYFCPSFR